ncbi:MAG TPA: hypothetical protein VI670_20030 [Thermoanaerobaculia bacterium]|jgi:ABC-type glycerol-3-phosphate transport system substrate-binding protein
MKMKLFWVNSPTKDAGLVISHTGKNATAFEAQINQWLQENPDINVQFIEQSAYGYGSFRETSVWLITVWYHFKAETIGGGDTP